MLLKCKCCVCDMISTWAGEENKYCLERCCRTVSKYFVLTQVTRSWSLIISLCWCSSLSWSTKQWHHTCSLITDDQWWKQTTVGVNIDLKTSSESYRLCFENETHLILFSLKARADFRRFTIDEWKQQLVSIPSIAQHRWLVSTFLTTASLSLQ